MFGFGVVLGMSELFRRAGFQALDDKLSALNVQPLESARVVRTLMGDAEAAGWFIAAGHAFAGVHGFCLGRGCGAVTPTTGLLTRLSVAFPRSPSSASVVCVMDAVVRIGGGGRLPD